MSAACAKRGTEVLAETMRFSTLMRESRGVKLLIALGIDALIVGVAAWSGFALRFADPLFSPNASQWLLIAVAPLLVLSVLFAARTYDSIVHYLSGRSLKIIAFATVSAAIAWSSAAFMLSLDGYHGMPRSVPLLFFPIAFMGLAGCRLLAGYLFEDRKRQLSGRKLLLVYGTDDFAQELAVQRHLSDEYYPVAFIDPKQEKGKRMISGIRCYGPDRIGWLIKTYGVDSVVVSAASLTRKERATVLKNLLDHPVRLTVLPIVTRAAAQTAVYDLMRPADIGDLIGQREANAADGLGAGIIEGRAVLVTGAGGSIGQELSRQVAKLHPRRLVILEASEPALFQVMSGLEANAKCTIVPVLNNLSDRGRVQRILAEHDIEVIFHAAAHKHVDLVERNIAAGVENNIFATLNLAEAAYAHGVASFVLISSDKAVRPTSMMGITKLWCEKIMLEMAARAEEDRQEFTYGAVRFGNVIGSSGSVIPLFNAQIAKGGPVTVTHPDVERYFMSIQEAVELVISAADLHLNGKIFALDLAERVRIRDIARMLIRLAGHTIRDDDNPDGQIAIRYTELKPGEKLYEDLFMRGDLMVATKQRHVFYERDVIFERQTFAAQLDALRHALERDDSTAMRSILRQLRDAAAPETDAGCVAEERPANGALPVAQGTARARAGSSNDMNSDAAPADPLIPAAPDRQGTATAATASTVPTAPTSQTAPTAPIAHDKEKAGRSGVGLD